MPQVYTFAKEYAFLRTKNSFLLKITHTHTKNIYRNPFLKEKNPLKLSQELFESGNVADAILAAEATVQQNKRYFHLQKLK